MPCNMAHQIDFHIDHDIVTAIALPNDIPVEADVDISLSIILSLSFH